MGTNYNLTKSYIRIIDKVYDKINDKKIRNRKKEKKFLNSE
jgi:hypothetical protein